MSDTGAPQPARPVSGPEYLVRCEALGLSAKADRELAFFVTDRTARRWELADQVPTSTAERLLVLEDMADQAVTALAEDLRAQADMGLPASVTVYPTSQALARHRLELPLPAAWDRDAFVVPAGWWRVVVARTVVQVPATVVLED